MIGDERVEEIRAGKLGRLKAVQELLDDREELLRLNSEWAEVMANQALRIEKLERVVEMMRNNGADVHPEVYDALLVLDEEKA